MMLFDNYDLRQLATKLDRACLLGDIASVQRVKHSVWDACALTFFGKDRQERRLDAEHFVMYEMLRKFGPYDAVRSAFRSVEQGAASQETARHVLSLILPYLSKDDAVAAEQECIRRGTHTSWCTPLADLIDHSALSSTRHKYAELFTAIGRDGHCRHIFQWRNSDKKDKCAPAKIDTQDNYYAGLPADTGVLRTLLKSFSLYVPDMCPPHRSCFTRTILAYLKRLAHEAYLDGRSWFDLDQRMFRACFDIAAGEGDGLLLHHMLRMFPDETVPTESTFPRLKLSHLGLESVLHRIELGPLYRRRAAFLSAAPIACMPTLVVRYLLEKCGLMNSGRKDMRGRVIPNREENLENKEEDKRSVTRAAHDLLRVPLSSVRVRSDMLTLFHSDCVKVIARGCECNNGPLIWTSLYRIKCADGAWRYFIFYAYPNCVHGENLNGCIKYCTSANKGPEDLNLIDDEALVFDEDTVKKKQFCADYASKCHPSRHFDMDVHEHNTVLDWLRRYAVRVCNLALERRVLLKQMEILGSILT